MGRVTDHLPSKWEGYHNGMHDTRLRNKIRDRKIVYGNDCEVVGCAWVLHTMSCFSARNYFSECITITSFASDAWVDVIF